MSSFQRGPATYSGGGNAAKRGTNKAGLIGSPPQDISINHNSFCPITCQQVVLASTVYAIKSPGHLKEQNQDSRTHEVPGMEALCLSPPFLDLCISSPVSSVIYFTISQ